VLVVVVVLVVEGAGEVDDSAMLADVAATPVVVISDPQATSDITAAMAASVIRVTGSTVVDRGGATLVPWALSGSVFR
jgi:hypothetical protein